MGSWVLGGAFSLELLGCAPRFSQLGSHAFVPSPAVTPAPSMEEGGAHLASSKSEKETTPTPAEEPSEAGPPTSPKFFEGREKVTYGEFISELRKIADELAADPDVAAAHQTLLKEKSLTEEELPLQSFSRVRLAFESARDSGLWGIRGTVTDQMPWSDRIWDQWSARAFSPEAPLAAPEAPAFPTAVGECDELGALFSILARDLGVIGFVGLHWPYWNHVVPIWQVHKTDGTFVRIIVPATQTFLDSKETIGTTGLPANRVVFPYVRKDRRDETELSADLVRFLLTQSQENGGLSTEELTMRRLWHRWNYRPDAAEKTIEKTAPPTSANVVSSNVIPQN